MGSHGVHSPVKQRRRRRVVLLLVIGCPLIGSRILTLLVDMNSIKLLPILEFGGVFQSRFWSSRRRVDLNTAQRDELSFVEGGQEEYLRI